MRQLTAIEASNDEMERQRFEIWFSIFSPSPLKPEHSFHTSTGRYSNVIIDTAWEAWQAALKSKQGEV